MSILTNSPLPMLGTFGLFVLLIIAVFIFWKKPILDDVKEDNLTFVTKMLLMIPTIKALIISDLTTFDSMIEYFWRNRRLLGSVKITAMLLLYGKDGSVTRRNFKNISNSYLLVETGNSFETEEKVDLNLYKHITLTVRMLGYEGEYHQLECSWCNVSRR